MGKGTGDQAMEALERRLGAEIDACVRRKPAAEAKLAAVARAIAPLSANVRTQLFQAAKALAKKSATDRELYGAAMRSLAELGDKRLAGLLSTTLKAEDAGGLASISAACFTHEAALAPPLAKAAASSKTQIAFAAEVARVCRGELSGPRLGALAPRIKEAHRISLCIDLFLPLSLELEQIDRRACLQMAEALHVLRGSERHLGRWLVMAEISHRGGDDRAIREAVEKTSTGPDSSRAAWSLVAWALEPSRGTGGTRPTTELVARLSHRPSADRDTSFLFRLAAAKADVARPMLEALARTKPMGDEVALRASCALARHFDRQAFARDVFDAAERAERPELRGLAAAAAWELGERERALAASRALTESDDLTALAWAAVVQCAAAQPAAKAPSELLLEPIFRRLQWGWAE